VAEALGRGDIDSVNGKRVMNGSAQYIQEARIEVEPTWAALHVRICISKIISSSVLQLSPHNPQIMLSSSAKTVSQTAAEDWR
jgi:hypothetical protein